MEKEMSFEEIAILFGFGICIAATFVLTIFDLKMRVKMSAQLDALTTEVTAIEASINAAIVKIQELLAEPAALDALTARLKAGQTALDNAVAGNVPPAAAAAAAAKLTHPVVPPPAQQKK